MLALTLGVYLLGGQLGWGVDSQLVGAHFNALAPGHPVPSSAPIAPSPNATATSTERQRHHQPKTALDSTAPVGS